MDRKSKGERCKFCVQKTLLKAVRLMHENELKRDEKKMGNEHEPKVTRICVYRSKC